jgi:hypothetical protein
LLRNLFKKQNNPPIKGSWKQRSVDSRLAGNLPTKRTHLRYLPSLKLIRPFCQRT